MPIKRNIRNNHLYYAIKKVSRTSFLLRHSLTACHTVSFVNNCLVVSRSTKDFNIAHGSNNITKHYLSTFSSAKCFIQLFLLEHFSFFFSLVFLPCFIIFHYFFHSLLFHSLEIYCLLYV